MAIDSTGDKPAASRPAPVVVRPTNRVNIAFGPFSKVEVQEPSKEFAELAAVVAELVSIVEGFAPGPKTAKLRQRAQMLVARLH
jgi:hypothetical protein